MNYPTLKAAEDFAGTLGGSKASSMIMDLVQEVRRVKAKNRQLRHEAVKIAARANNCQRLRESEVCKAAELEQRAESAERRLREIEARGLLT
jgi:uncharacterized protein YlxW (UPF0749 family)